MIRKPTIQTIVPKKAIPITIKTNPQKQIILPLILPLHQIKSTFSCKKAYNTRNPNKEIQSSNEQNLKYQREFYIRNQYQGTLKKQQYSQSLKQSCQCNQKHANFCINEANYFYYHRGQIFQASLWVFFKSSNYYKLFSIIKFVALKTLQMFIAHARYLTKNKNLISKLQPKSILHPKIKSSFQINFNQSIRLVNKQQFSSKKPKNPIIQQKATEKKIQLVEDSEFLWKLNLAFNFIGIASGFYFPKEALMFVLMSNGMFQVYESSKEINKMIKISDKNENLRLEEVQNAIITIKGSLQKVAINGGITTVLSILTGMGVIYPSFAEYSLMVLPFWILYKLKFNDLSHGYYFVLLSLALFQYFYFTKVFQSKDKPQQKP